MRSIRIAGWLALAGALMAPSNVPSPFSAGAADIAGPMQQAEELSVLTYNVKALPWPIASGRGPALATIGESLASMRRSNAQPDVVLLQEAFTDDAKAIADAAGYDHVAIGPQAAPVVATTPLGADYANEARWDRGEESGNVLDSGLVILSDYPIVKSENLAFPQGACAGFDCLAAKGVQIVWIAVPGIAKPVAVANTHLNSRGATHVALGRADAAFAWQVAEAQRFIAGKVSADTPVIFGGDFNIGDVPQRLADFAAARPLGVRQKDALQVAMASGTVARGALFDARAIADYNKDLVLYRQPRDRSVTLRPCTVHVTFPLASITNALSDHAGFTVHFRLN